jgi:hypothetical protein
MEGQVQKFLLGIVAVLLLLSIIGATIGTVDTGAKTLGVDQRCASASCFYNVSRTTACTTHNVTTGDTTSCGSQYQTAFSGETLFSGGLLTTIVILACFMVIVGAAWIKFKNK